MRIFLVVVAVAVLAPGVARGQQAPSKVLERAIKLYDKEDYFSASIELNKVLSGESGDDALNTQRALFFMAKTQYQLGFYASSLALLQRIEADPDQAYRDASLKWVLALARALPEWSGVLETIALYPPGSTALAELGELRDEYQVLYGRAMIARGSFDEALNSVMLVEPQSPWYAAANLQRGVIMFRTTDLAEGIEAMAFAAQDPVLAQIATHDLAFWTRMHTEPAAAGPALRKIADAGGPSAPAATLALSRIETEKVVDLSALRGLTDAFDAMALVAVCERGTTDNLLGVARPIVDTVREVLMALARIDDNAELFLAARRHLEADTADGSVLRLSLGVAEPLRWEAELARELKELARADAAWRTTMIAAEIETELTLQHALAEAQAGQWLRSRFELLDGELARVAPVDVMVAAHRDPDRAGIVVLPALCELAGLQVTPVVEEPTPTPLPVKKGGCAGCSTGGGAEASALVLGLAVLGLRRSARRRLTPARLLE